MSGCPHNTVRRCVECERAVRRDRERLKRQTDIDYAERGREYARTNHRRNYYQRTYGVSKLSVQLRWLEQNGGCAICGVEIHLYGRHTHLDHCHSTGTVRGLLCRQCNWGLGHFRDSRELLNAAANYLETYE